MFTLPSGSVEAEGAIETNPIRLPPDIKDADFANFLEVLHPEFAVFPYSKHMLILSEYLL